MENNIFRKKSLDTLSSPENLNEYLRVTNPAIWAVLAAVIIFLAGALGWSSFAAFESYVTGKAVAEDGVLTITFDSPDAEKNVESGMVVSVGNTKTEVSTLGKDGEGRVVAGAEANVPDGEYDVRVSYKRTRILSLLFN